MMRVMNSAFVKRVPLILLIKTNLSILIEIEIQARIATYTISTFGPRSVSSTEAATVSSAWNRVRVKKESTKSATVARDIFGRNH